MKERRGGEGRMQLMIGEESRGDREEMVREEERGVVRQNSANNK